MDGITQDLKKFYADPVVKALIPVAGMMLNVACPAVPAVVWTALITAVVSGDLTPEHIQEFMEAHNIKIYSAPEDFPNARSTSLSAGSDNGNYNRPEGDT